MYKSYRHSYQYSVSFNSIPSTARDFVLNVISVRNWLRERKLKEPVDYRFDSTNMHVHFKDGRIAMLFKLAYG
jgi:hypothetical protein